MPVQYKDFDKDVKDLLTKQFGTAWKIENKFKGPKDTVFINPMADAKGVNVDVELNCTKTGVKSKINVNPDLIVKPKFTYEFGGSKVEVGTLGDVRRLDYEVNYEIKEKGYAGAVKVTKKNVEASAVVSVAHHCVVGAGVTHDLNGKGPIAYSVGTRYNAQGAIFNVSTAAFQSFTVGVLKGLRICDRNVTVATQVVYANGKPNVTAGVEFPCLLFPECNTIKLRVNDNLNVAIAVIHKFADSWKAALAWEYTGNNKNLCQFGLQLVREPK